jgi:predicted transcriptional regulator
MAANPSPHAGSLRSGADQSGEAFVENELLSLTARVVSAHVAHKEVPVEQLPSLIRAVYQALAAVRQAHGDPIKAQVVAAADRTVAADHIVCLECGESYRVLKRHLLTEHQMTPDQYRAKWGLPVSHPLVAPEYAVMRSQLARDSGLGRKVEAISVRKRGRPKQA